MAWPASPPIRRPGAFSPGPRRFALLPQLAGRAEGRAYSTYPKNRDSHPETTNAKGPLVYSKFQRSPLIEQAALIFLAAVLLLLPGAAWLAWSGRPQADPAGLLADAAALSMALAAVGGMVSFFSGVRLSPGGLLLLFLIAGGALLLAVRRRRPAIRGGAGSYLPLLVFAGIILFRFLQAAELVLPAWVDSLHHTLLVRLILEQGTVPQSFEPYMPVTLYYHFGLHASASLFAALAGLSAENSLLVFGQLVNALVALGIYRLGMSLWNDWRRATLGMALVGFIFQMPAYYLTWGRYTLLAGVFLLTAAMALAVELVHPEAGDWAPDADQRWSHRLPWLRIGALALLTGGVILTHYFAAVLLAAFFAILLLQSWLAAGTAPRGGERRSTWALLAAAAIGLAVTLPWLWHVIRHAAAFLSVQVVAPGDSLDQVYFSDYLGYLGFLLGPRRSHLLHLLGLVALVVLVWRDLTGDRRARQARPLGLWTWALLILSIPWGIHLVPFRPDHGVILAFLPASLLIADLLVRPLEIRFRPVLRWLARFSFLILFILLLAWGLRETREIINPVTVLAGQGDRAAIEWIRDNTTPQAVFLTNIVAWQAGSFRGVDGGWWILPLTGRRTLLPPALYVQGERSWVLSLNEQAGDAAQLTGCSPEFWQLVEEAGITHIYLGTVPGSVTPESLADCSDLVLVYDRLGVQIYRVAWQE